MNFFCDGRSHKAQQKRQTYFFKKNLKTLSKRQNSF